MQTLCFPKHLKDKLAISKSALQLHGGGNLHSQELAFLSSGDFQLLIPLKFRGTTKRLFAIVDCFSLHATTNPRLPEFQEITFVIPGILRIEVIRGNF